MTGVFTEGSRGARLVVLFLLAFALRLAFFFQWEATPYGGLLFGDGLHFHSLGALWAEGKPALDLPFYQSPVYPAFLAGLYKAFGASPQIAALAQILLGSLLCLGISEWARSLGGERAAWIAGALAALYRPWIFYAVVPLKPTLEAAAFFAVAWALTRVSEEKTPWKSGTAGLAAGFAAALRGNALFLWVVPLLLWGKQRRTGWFLLGAFVAVSPITAANVLGGKDSVFLTWSGGFTFFQGNHREADGTGRYPSSLDAGDLARGEEAFLIREASTDPADPVKPSEASRFWFRRGLSEIAARPLGALLLQLRKAFLVLNARELPDNYDFQFIQDRFSTVLSLPFVSFGMVFPFLFLGIARALRERGSSDAARMLAALSLAYAASLIPFFVNARFRLPLVALALPLAALEIDRFWTNRRKTPWRWIAAVAGLWLVAALPVSDRRRGNAVALSQLSDLSYRQGKPREAVGYFNEAIHADFSAVSPRAFVAAGLGLRALGRTLEAEEFFATALERFPGHSELREASRAGR